MEIKRRGIFVLKKTFFIHFMIRSIIGMGTIFLVNEFLSAYEIEQMVGVNLISFLTSGILGIPGIAIFMEFYFYRFCKRFSVISNENLLSYYMKKSVIL